MERNHGCDMSNPQTRVLSYSDVRPTTSVLHHPLDRMILDRNYVDYRPVYSQRSTATDRYVDYEDEAILSTGAYTTAVQSGRHRRGSLSVWERGPAPAQRWLLCL